MKEIILNDEYYDALAANMAFFSAQNDARIRTAEIWDQTKIKKPQEAFMIYA